MKKRNLSRAGYAEVFPPPLSDIEVARMWRGLGAIASVPQRRRPRRPPVLLGVAAAVLAAAVAFVVVLVLSPAGETPAGISEDGRGSFEFPDGSRIAVATDSAIKMVTFVPEDIELLLLHGSAEFTIAPAAAGTRRFVVTAGGFELLPRAGRFRAALVGDFPERRVEVVVHEGQLEIPQHRADGPGPLSLGAGQSWSSEPLATAMPTGAPVLPLE